MFIEKAQSFQRPGFDGKILTFAHQHQLPPEVYRTGRCGTSSLLRRSASEFYAGADQSGVYSHAAS